MRKLRIYLYYLSIILLFSGCSPKLNSKEMNDSIENIESEDFAFIEGEDIKFINGYAKDFYSYSGNIYFYSVMSEIDNTSKEKLNTYTIYELNSEFKPNTLAKFNSDFFCIEQMVPADSDNIYIVVKSKNDEFTLKKIDKASHISTDIEDFEIEDFNGRVLNNNIGFKLYIHNERIYLIDRNEFCEYDMKFNLINRFEIDGNVELSCMNEKYIYALVHNMDSECCIYRINLDDFSYDTLRTEHNDLKLFYSGNNENEIYIGNSKYIHRLNYSEKTENSMCSLLDTDLPDYSTDSIFVYNDDLFFLPKYSAGDTGSLLLYTKSEDKTEIETLVLMGTYANPEIEQAVAYFNRTHSDIRIKLTDFEDRISPEESFNLEISKGNYPDMYILDGMGLGYMSIDSCISKGMFADIRQYILSDEELNESDFIDKVYQTMLHGDKLYFISSYFSVYALAMNDVFLRELVNKNDGIFNYEILEAYADMVNSDAMVIYGDSKELELRHFLEFGMKSFVDFENAESHFDNDDFKTVLDLCNRGDFDEISEDTVIDEIKNRNLIGIDMDINVTGIQFLEEAFGESLYMTGYPETGTLCSFSDGVAMSVQCENKDAAWEFMSMLVSKDYLIDTYYKSDAGRIPIRKDMIEPYFEMYKHEDDFQDSFGNNVDGKLGSGMAVYGSSISLHEITEGEIEYIYDAIDKIGGIYGCDENIYMIVKEEAGDYFSGDKNINDVTELIQNRANNYLNEME